MNLCDNNRTETIEAAKTALIKGTNIEDSPEEMKVLDNILFRCWQMGWLDRYAPPRHFNAMPKERSERQAAGHGSNVPMQPNVPPMPSNTSNALDALADAYKAQSNALGEQTKWNRMMLHLADLQLTYSPDWGANGQGDQKLYDFVTELIDEFSGWDVSDTNVGNKMQLSGESATKGTTFARGHENGLKRTEERTETHGVCLDAISRQAAIELCDWYDNPSMREDLEKLRPVRFSADTISRKAAIKEVSRNIPVKRWKDVARVVELMKIFADRIEQLPPAEPESDSGRWERHYSRPGVYADLYWHCSKCGYKTDYQYANVNHHYCPNCGRKMEGEVTDETD